MEKQKILICELINQTNNPKIINNLYQLIKEYIEYYSNQQKNEEE